MDIAKYDGYFHDGLIYNIDHHKNEVIITMESSEITDNDIEQQIALSKHHTIAGKLHIENIKTIDIDERLFQERLYKIYDYGEIFYLDIKKKHVTIEVTWVNLADKNIETGETDLITIDIEAEKIWWENLPEMVVD